MRKLTLAGPASRPTLHFPLKAITERFSILGMSGSGKTYAGQLLAEQMMDVGAPIGVIDPASVWWGLLSMASGKRAGYPIYIFGGDHAHVPIEPTQGTLVAETVLREQISFIIDTGDFTVSESTRFYCEFAERFYQLQKRSKRPIHLFIDEAHNVVPQFVSEKSGDVRFGPQVMVNRWERLMRQGRSCGIGWTLISQMPQAVAKKVLWQAPTMIAMRLLGKNERKVVAEWMQDKATDEGQLDLDQRLKKLETGEAWIASPVLLKLFMHVKLNRKVTFDSSATPEFGGRARQPRVLSNMDVAKLGEAIKVATQATADADPVELRKKIEELRTEKRNMDGAFKKAMGEWEKMRDDFERLQKEHAALKKQKDSKPVSPRVIARLEKNVKALRDIGETTVATAELLSAAIGYQPLKTGTFVIPPRERLSAYSVKPEQIVTALRDATPADTMKAISELQQDFKKNFPKIAAGFQQQEHKTRVLLREKLARPETQAGIAKVKLEASDKLPRGARDMLVALTTGGLTRSALGLQACVKPTKSTFRASLGALKSRGLVGEDAAGVIFITEAGVAACGNVRSVPRTFEELYEMWKPRLNAGARRMIEAMLIDPPGSIGIPRELLALRSKIDEHKSTFRAALGSVKTAGLVVENGGLLRLAQ